MRWTGDKSLLLLVAWALLSAMSLAQAGDQMSYSSVSKTRFGPLPVLPSCMTTSAVHGDPTKGPATILAKAATGCVVPWHWHTTNEQLMFVAGTGTIEPKGASGHDVKGGDFLFLPAKQAHQFTCTATCLFYDVIDGAFDIHYIDKAGNEIPAAQVLKKQPKATSPKRSQ
jgi:quercetin dioxygenase-like cupin family protein